MNKKRIEILFLVLLLFTGFKSPDSDQDGLWKKTAGNKFDIWYPEKDPNALNICRPLMVRGYDSVKSFFGVGFPNHFDVFIHPGRRSLDSTWATDWKVPGFKSECWMVASGVAKRIDILSPVTWDTASCEHKFGDKQATAQVIAHELVHVFHGQFNKSPDFSETDKIDWFVEGLATYASGQLTGPRIEEIKKAIHDNEVPSSLDEFWTGKLRYGQSGSVVAYLDQRFGRATILKLLVFNKKADLLSSLGIGEKELLEGWKLNIERHG